MRIRGKLVLVVLPLIITPLLLVALAASLAARNGITRVATGLLLFKVEQLATYAQTQWKLLQDNGLAANPEFVAVSQAAVESFARGLVRSDTEVILALDSSGELAMSTSGVALEPGELERLGELVRDRQPRWLQLRLAGQERVGQGMPFEPFGWYLLVTEKRAVFYQAVNQIYWQSGLILLVGLAGALALLVYFMRLLTHPLSKIVEAMRQVITSGDLSGRVALEYGDEIGELGHTFNLMTSELGKAYNQIKSYAFRAAVAQRNEQKVRTIFQSYVPAHVIDQFFANPAAMLEGQNAELAVLFSDIRGFTTIAEMLTPKHIVDTLNSYFGPMVDAIMAHGGIPDKYIGDAIMAFFGAPVKREDDALQATFCAFDMLEALELFNARQRERGLAAFKVGIGLNFGEVTVGNIGSEKKMDYTVIGDEVNLASRLEGLTKVYGVPLLVSESVYRQISGQVRCRLADRVVVKGRSGGTAIYVPQKKLAKREEDGWKSYEAGVVLYYERQFEKAAERFAAALERMPGDTLSRTFLDRAQRFSGQPPEPEWTGTTVITEK
jgi:adenylate cyclase